MRSPVPVEGPAKDGTRRARGQYGTGNPQRADLQPV